MSKVAVVGGGVFGCTAAIYAAYRGYEVHLFEKLDDILKGASSINQYRLHRGYHYPRSLETAQSSLEGEISFNREYGDAIIRGGAHYYSIAREGSLVTPEEFLSFCKSLNLPYTQIDLPLVNPKNVALSVQVEEEWFDPAKLEKLIKGKIKHTGVVVHLKSEPTQALLNTFDYVVVATYAHLNSVLPREQQQEYQFEVCEKPVVTLPDEFGLTGVVVMDGPFMSVDPFGHTGKFVLGNVVHAIHATNIGLEPHIPNDIQPLLNRGIVENPKPTKFGYFIEHGREFIPLLANARHVGSMFTVRTVLPRQEATDARPTLVSKIDNRYIKVFSGKIGNCVLAAEQVVSLLG